MSIIIDCLLMLGLMVLNLIIGIGLMVLVMAAVSVMVDWLSMSNDETRKKIKNIWFCIIWTSFVAILVY